jgi:uncharacterized membrane protein
MSKNRKRVTFVVYAALIAAIYSVLSLVFAPISAGPIQVRIAEALCVLPYFTVAAIPGLFVGCIISNCFVSGMIWADIVFGSLATLIAAILAFALRRFKCLVPLPAVVLNALVVPFVLKYGYGFGDALWFMALTVGLGQICACYGLGLPLLITLERSRVFDRNMKKASNETKGNRNG